MVHGKASCDRSVSTIEMDRQGKRHSQPGHIVGISQEATPEDAGGAAISPIEFLPFRLDPIEKASRNSLVVVDYLPSLVIWYCLRNAGALSSNSSIHFA